MTVSGAATVLVSSSIVRVPTPVPMSPPSLTA